MSHRVPRLLLAAGSAVLLAAVAAAEEPAKHAFPARETWKAGEVATGRGSQTTSQKVSVKGADGTPLPGGMDSTEAVEYEVVVKVLEVDAEGRPTKSRVHFPKWSRKAGDETDASLAGVHAEVTGAGTAKAVKVVHAPTEPTAQAKAWLEERFGARSGERDERREALFPGKPVAVGESWDVGPEKLTAMFSNPNQTYLAEKSTGKVTLVSVEDGIGEFRFEATLQSAALATPMGPLDWSEGGALTVDARFTRALDATRHDGRGSTTVRLAGKAAPPGASVEVDIRSEQGSSLKSGGEMPEAGAPPGK